MRLGRSWKIGIHSDMATPVEAEAVSSSSVVSGGISISSEVIDNTIPIMPRLAALVMRS